MQISEVNPDNLGSQVLEIWNERVSAIRKLYKFTRTVALLKSDNLDEVAVFEYDTLRFDQELYEWNWNLRGNLEGYLKGTKEHCFTWQPHGSQFTIVEKVPSDCLVIKIRLPKKIDKGELLQTIGFDKSWVTVVKRQDNI